MKRNGHLVVKAKRQVKFDSKLVEWCTVQNFHQMYNDVYEELAKIGIATKLEQPAWFNQEGSIVQLEEEAFSLKLQNKSVLRKMPISLSWLGFTASTGRPLMCAGSWLCVSSKAKN